MRPGWKNLAELADTPAFSIPQVTQAVIGALSEDWREEVGPDVLEGLRKVLADSRQGALFANQTAADLDSLRGIAAGRPLALTLIECASQASANGLTGEAALESAASQALALGVSRGIRQVEEHYLRNSDSPRATNVRERSEEAAGNSGLDKLARYLTKIDPSAAPEKPSKRDDVDDGVPF